MLGDGDSVDAQDGFLVPTWLDAATQELQLGGGRGQTRQKGQFFSFARKSVSQLAIGGLDPAMRRPPPPEKLGHPEKLKFWGN